MKRVEIYLKHWCPYCQRAIQLLDRHGIEYSAYDVEAEPERRSEMLARADGRRTVPQIFIDGAGIGGYDELFAASVDGSLKERLAEPLSPTD